MKDLNYQLKQLVKDNKEGSFQTQKKRWTGLNKIANTLHEKGFKNMNAKSLKPKHVECLVEHWKAQGLASGTIANYMTSLRWWAKHINKPAVVQRDNGSYGLEQRKYVTNESKSQELDKDKVGKIKDERIRMSLELQAAFGLRREESIKFNPEYADKENQIRLKSTWTKGGKERYVPIRNDYQREVLERAKGLAKGGSLIPPDKKYVEQLRVYEKSTRNAELSKLHGLRHHYAQQRYIELTGNLPPALGGVPMNKLRGKAKAIDHEARLTISKELGHERKQVVSIYLGGRK